ncbi:MAG: gliding motility protein GldL, partial [Paludibacteraceae bacterium]|nr:gliding motility protein GldL [Paludibacteraceae bacterium]
MAKSEKAEKATEGAQKMGAWAKFMHWYESYQGKRIVGVVYSIGASVVIVGALFKIMHWPGASIVLVSGMITEAFLFVIGALDKPHPEFNWSNVFPQLLEFGTDPAILEKKAAQARPTLLGAGVEGGEIPV